MINSTGLLQLLLSVVVIAIVCLASTPLHRYLPHIGFRTEVSALDGLRGLLALLVVLHHFYLRFALDNGIAWGAPPLTIFHLHGEIGVSVFFMITAFLFWNKIRKSNGQMNIQDFFLNRFCRIAPVYYLHVLCVVLIAFLLGASVFPLPDFLLPVGRWLCFALFGRPDIGGVVDTAIIGAGVTWTLAYEWWFYFSIPLFCWLFRQRRGALFSVGAAIVLTLAGWNFPRQLTVPEVYSKFFIFFLPGILATYIIENKYFSRFANSKWSAAALIAIGSTLYGFFNSIYSFWPIFLLGTGFTLIAAGSDFFGVLRTRGVQALGKMSYSIYLLHGLLLMVVYGFLWRQALVFRGLDLILPGHLLGFAILTVVLSAVSYRFVEFPVMRAFYRRRQTKV